jgi:hypothetical protein
MALASSSHVLAPEMTADQVLQAFVAMLPFFFSAPLLVDEVKADGTSHTELMALPKIQ